MRIYQEKTGAFSPTPDWVCIHKEYIYIAPTLEELIIILNTEWEDDKHLGC